MNSNDLLSTLRAAGVVLSLDGQRLRFFAPKGVLTNELRRLVAEHRQAIVSHLAGDPAAERPAPATDPPESSGPKVGGGCRCGSVAYRDVVLYHEPHNGQSTRRDCAACGRTLDFPRWYRVVTP